MSEHRHLTDDGVAICEKLDEILSKLHDIDSRLLEKPPLPVEVIDYPQQGYPENRYPKQRFLKK